MTKLLETVISRLDKLKLTNLSLTTKAKRKRNKPHTVDHCGTPSSTASTRTRRLLACTIKTLILLLYQKYNLHPGLS